MFGVLVYKINLKALMFDVAGIRTPLAAVRCGALQNGSKSILPKRRSSLQALGVTPIRALDA